MLDSIIAPDFKSDAEINSTPAKKDHTRNGPFDWSPDNPDVVLAHQPATAVFENPHGQIVIKQEGWIGDSDIEICEMWIVINRVALPQIINRLQHFLSTADGLDIPAQGKPAR
jgi:hypothetical protein